MFCTSTSFVRRSGWHAWHQVKSMGWLVHILTLIAHMYILDILSYIYVWGIDLEGSLTLRMTRLRPKESGCHHSDVLFNMSKDLGGACSAPPPHMTSGSCEVELEDSSTYYLQLDEFNKYAGKYIRWPNSWRVASALDWCPYLIGETKIQVTLSHAGPITGKNSSIERWIVVSTSATMSLLHRLDAGVVWDHFGSILVLSLHRFDCLVKSVIVIVAKQIIWFAVVKNS